jgi:predicted amidophosphoribosyltransferase
LRGLSCRRCGLPLEDSAGGCARCAARPLPLDRVAAAFVYDDIARRFLLRAKAGGRRELLAPFGRQLTAAIRSSGIAEGVDAIVGVPTHPVALLRRGFDPAAAISRAVARETGIRLDRGRLRRRLGLPRAAKSLTAEARWREARRAFVATLPGTGTFLLVDDVMTTGATASSCALALYSAGAVSVRLAVWARTL